MTPRTEARPAGVPSGVSRDKESSRLSLATLRIVPRENGGPARPTEWTVSNLLSDVSISNAGNDLLIPPGPPLTLASLEQLAIANNPTLQQAVAVLDKARGIREQVGLSPNPIIGYSGEEIGNEGHGGQQGGFVSQTIVTGHKLRLNRAVAGWDVQSLTWEYEAQRYRVRNDVQAGFYAVLGAQRRVRLADDLLEVAQQGVRVAEELLRAQQGTRPDILQAKVQLNRVRIIRQNARYDYQASWNQLVSLVGVPDLTPAPLLGNLERDLETRDWDTLFANLLANSPELQAAQMRVQRGRSQIRRQAVQPIPNLFTQVGVAHDTATGSTITGVQVGIPLPLFNRNQGNRDFAYAEYRRAVSDVERLQLALRHRLATAFRDYGQARQQVERYKMDILPTARENLDLTEEGYKQGEFDFIRVLTARRTFFETNLNYVDSLVALQQSNVALSGLLLSGGLNDVRDISKGAGGIRNRGRALNGR